MYRFVFVIIALIAGIAVLGNADVSGKSMGSEVMCIPMGDIPLGPPAGVDRSRPVVNFPHALHFSDKCQSCHHTWDGSDAIQSCMTSGCHDLAESPLKSGEGDPIQYYKNAYHKMCIGCHKAIQVENKKLEASGKLLADQLPKYGPTSCKGCHAE